MLKGIEAAGHTPRGRDLAGSQGPNFPIDLNERSLKNSKEREFLQRIKTFHDSTHTGRRRNERGISIQSMKDVVMYCDVKRQQYPGLHGGFVYKFTKQTL
jgi:hypothetical protein